MLDNIPMAPPNNLLLSHVEITKLVYKWIGVEGGYLVGFSYSSHDRFWLDICDLAISTSAFAGTTRECFEATLFNASAADQANVLREVLDRYPAEEIAPESKLRSQKLQSEILSWIARLETGQVAVPMNIESPTDFVRRALDDADSLLRGCLEIN